MPAVPLILITTRTNQALALPAGAFLIARPNLLRKIPSSQRSTTTRPRLPRVPTASATTTTAALFSRSRTSGDWSFLMTAPSGYCSIARHATDGPARVISREPSTSRSGSENSSAKQRLRRPETGLCGLASPRSKRHRTSLSAGPVQADLEFSGVLPPVTLSWPVGHDGAAWSK